MYSYIFVVIFAVNISLPSLPFHNTAFSLHSSIFFKATISPGFYFLIHIKVWNWNFVLAISTTNMRKLSPVRSDFVFWNYHHHHHHHHHRHHHYHHHHISVMELGHWLTRSGLTYPEVSSKVCHDSFCQLGNSVSLPWVIYYESLYLHVVSSFCCIPVICLKSALILISLQLVYLFCNLSKCILLFFSCISSLLMLFFWRHLL